MVIETFLNGLVTMLIGDVLERIAEVPDESVDCVVVSPPYWGMRDYGVTGQIGLEPSLGEHLDVMVAVFREVRRVLKPQGTLWINYGDSYASQPNGRTAAATKAAGKDDRTYRDKPMATIGPIRTGAPLRAGRSANLRNTASDGVRRNFAGEGGLLKPKDLCMIPNRLAIALQEDGWWVRAEIVWGKPNPMPDSSGKYRPSTAHEKIFMLTKSGRHFYDADAVAQQVSASTNARVSQNVANQVGSARANGGARSNGNMKAVIRAPKTQPDRGIRNSQSFVDSTCLPVETRYLRNYEPAPLEVWTMATQPFAESHFATFPPELAERCILAGCPEGGHVLDPFGGAGTTALVAAALGRRATLIELNPEYAKLARARIEAAFMGKHEGARHMVKQLGKHKPFEPGTLFAEAP